MERVGEAFVWPFRDPKWVEKIVIMGLILLIPIIGAIDGYGWLIAAIRRLREGKEELPPANFNYLGKGFEAFIVLLVYSLVAIVASALFFVPAILLLNSQSGEGGNGLLITVGVLLLFGGFGVAIVAFLLYFLIRPAVILGVDHRGIEGGLDLGSIARRLRVSPVNALIAGLMLIAAGFIASLGSYVCLVGIIFTVPYSLAIEAWIVRSYEVGSTPKEALDVRHPTTAG